MSHDAVREPPLAYEPSSSQYATRRQFRLLLALVVLNLLITSQLAYFPGLAASVRQRWAEYQQKRERAAAVKKALALEQQAMVFTEPAGKVVWDENPDTAAKLLAGSGYREIVTMSMPKEPAFAIWPDGARGEPHPLIHQLFPAPRPEVDMGEEGVATVLLHGRKSPGGTERLVAVFLWGRLRFDGSRLPDAPLPPGQAWSSTADKTLYLIAWPLHPGRGEKPPQPEYAKRGSLLIHPDDAPAKIRWHYTPPSPDGPARIHVEGRQLFRFYAGRPDPADASRFTIDYDMDGKPGTIHGRLKDDGSLELKPTTGVTAGTRWYPQAPATQPAGQ